MDTRNGETHRRPPGDRSRQPAAYAGGEDGSGTTRNVVRKSEGTCALLQYWQQNRRSGAIDGVPKEYRRWDSRSSSPTAHGPRNALRLKEIAEAGGHDAWMDLFDIRPSTRLAGELEQGVSNADVLCLLLSPSAVASPWVREELRYALAAEEKGLR